MTDQRWGQRFAMAPPEAMQAYDETLVAPMFTPWAALLLDEVAPAAGEAVLDVATGPGSLARLAAARVGPAGRVTGCDISAAMLDVARSKPALSGTAPIEYVECPADALAVPDGAFDVVTCQQGLQFFPDRPAALAEMRRAARPGARLGIAVWAAIEDCPPFAALAAAVAEVLGDEAGAAYRAGPWGMGSGEGLAALAEEAGFREVAVARRRLPVVFEDGPAQLVASLPAAAVAAQVAAIDDAGRAALLAAAESAMAPLVVDGQVRSHLTSHVVTAVA